ncbi:MAG: LON peptidase substrate-binding domain-containing protein, partial [Ignavibacteria bacterium]
MAKSKEEKKEIIKPKTDIIETAGEVIYEKQSSIPDLNVTIPTKLPILPLKDIVVFPYMMFPILAGRESTIMAINKSIEKDKFILLVTQLDEKIEEPTFENLYKTGTIAKIIQVLRLPNGLIKVLVDGLVTAKVKKFYSEKYISADFDIRNNAIKKDTELEALIRQATKLFTEYVQINRTIPQETLVAYENIREPDRKLYYIASTINADVHKKQQILEIADLHKQY